MRPAAGGPPGGPRVVRVLPDEPGIDKTFDYLVPDAMDGDVRVGTVVRVSLHGRRVGGWVVAEGVEPPEGVALRPLAKVTGWGPAPELIDLAAWAAWRWAGRRAHFLRTASPPGAVRGLPPTPTSPPPAATVADRLAAEALALGRSVVRLAPAVDAFPLLVQAAANGTTLVVAPSHADAGRLAMRLRRAGVDTAVMPRDWALAAAGARVVIGARAAAWAPARALACVVVLDEHAEAHQEESAPTWHARDVALERARRAGAVCVLTSPCPSLEALAAAPLLSASRPVERAGWPGGAGGGPPPPDTRRGAATNHPGRPRGGGAGGGGGGPAAAPPRREDPLRVDLYSTPLVDLVRSGRKVVCVLNRKGRHRLLACAACAELARCERCGAAVGSGADDVLTCGRCDQERPPVCLHCGTTRLKVRRLGVSRAREDLERLAGVPVVEVTGESDPTVPVPDVPVLVGTEAVLHRVGDADVVAFLDLDVELLAPRYRAAEEALAMVARAARLVGGKAGGGRLLLQTRLPHHEVVQAALFADPARVSAVEADRRRELRFPPAVALARVSGAGAEVFVEGLGEREGVELLGPLDGAWLVRSADHQGLCSALAATPRPPGRLRVAVDPARL